MLVRSASATPSAKCLPRRLRHMLSPCQQLLAGLVAACCLTDPSFAGPAFNLDQLIGIGLNENAYVLASREQVAAAKGDATIARAYPNPDIGGQLGRSKERNSLTPISGQVYNITMAQPIEIPMVRSARIDAADEIVKATDASRQGLEDRVQNVGHLGQSSKRIFLLGRNGTSHC